MLWTVPTSQTGKEKRNEGSKSLKWRNYKYVCQSYVLNFNWDLHCFSTKQLCKVRLMEIDWIWLDDCNQWRSRSRVPYILRGHSSTLLSKSNNAQLFKINATSTNFNSLISWCLTLLTSGSLTFYAVRGATSCLMVGLVEQDVT